MAANLTALTELISWINEKGWSPATSTNYSMKGEIGEFPIWVSRSGVDKSAFTQQDFIPMNIEGEHAPGYEAVKPSAETALHLEIFRQTSASVILHTHSKSDTVLSRIIGDKQKDTRFLKLSRYELLKGLRHVNTHESSVNVPCYPNTQDIDGLASELASYLKTHEDCLGFLIDSHGFYTWGESLDEAKRHLEVFQFLFECELEMRALGQ